MKKCDHPLCEQFNYVLGNFNRHIGRHIDGFDQVHVGYDIGERNLGERILFVFCLDKECQIDGLREQKTTNNR